jgi:hypothetical protein
LVDDVTASLFAAGADDDVTATLFSAGAGSVAAAFGGGFLSEVLLEAWPFS